MPLWHIYLTARCQHAQAAARTEDELSRPLREASLESCMSQLSQAEETAASAREDAAALRYSMLQARANVDTLRQAADTHMWLINQHT